MSVFLDFKGSKKTLNATISRLVKFSIYHLFSVFVCIFVFIFTFLFFSYILISSLLEFTPRVVLSRYGLELLHALPVVLRMLVHSIAIFVNIVATVN